MKRCFHFLLLGACCLLLCPSGDADEAPDSAPEDELKVARQRFEEQVNAAVEAIRERHLTQLEGLQRAMARRGDFEASLKVKAEIEWLKASVSPYRSIPLEGEWEVRYSNKSTRTYRILPHGKVEFSGRTGQLELKGDDMLLDFGDGKLEQLHFGLVVDHFNPASRYPTQAPSVTGTGKRLAEDETPKTTAAR